MCMPSIYLTRKFEILLPSYIYIQVSKGKCIFKCVISFLAIQERYTYGAMALVHEQQPPNWWREYGFPLWMIIEILEISVTSVDTGIITLFLVRIFHQFTQIQIISKVFRIFQKNWLNFNQIQVKILVHCPKWKSKKRQIQWKSIISATPKILPKPRFKTPKNATCNNFSVVRGFQRVVCWDALID